MSSKQGEKIVRNLSFQYDHINLYKPELTQGQLNVLKSLEEGTFPARSLSKKNTVLSIFGRRK